MEAAPKSIPSNSETFDNFSNSIDNFDISLSVRSDNDPFFLEIKNKGSSVSLPTFDNLGSTSAKLDKELRVVSNTYITSNIQAIRHFSAAGTVNGTTNTVRHINTVRRECIFHILSNI